MVVDLLISPTFNRKVTYGGGNSPTTTGKCRIVHSTANQPQPHMIISLKAEIARSSILLNISALLYQILGAVLTLYTVWSLELNQNSLNHAP